MCGRTGFRNRGFEIEFHDLDDVRYLLRHLGIQTAAEAIRIVEQYVPTPQIPAKARFALEELLEN